MKVASSGEVDAESANGDYGQRKLFFLLSSFRGN